MFQNIVVATDDSDNAKRARAVENVIDKDRIIHIDTNPLFKGYTDVFLYTDVPEETRKELARMVADKILEKLREE
jgi:hypothetical protein